MANRTIHFFKPVAGHWMTDEGAEMANRYVDMKRADLGLGHMSDLEMANAIYMADRHSLDLIKLQTAAKERIRWLSAQLASSQAEIARQRDNLRNQRAWVQHWQEDVAAGVMPSTGSLAKALENLDAALDAEGQENG